MKKIALVVILGIVVGVSNFGTDLPDLASAAVSDPVFDFNHGSLRFQNGNKKIIHNVQTADQGIFNATYELRASGEGEVYIRGNDNFAKGNLLAYKLMKFKQGGTTETLSANYYLFILESVAYFDVSRVGALPRAMVLASKDANGRIVVQNFTGFPNYHYKQAGGGIQENFQWYIKKFSRFLIDNNPYSNIVKIQEDSSITVGVDNDKLLQAYRDCTRNLFIERAVDKRDIPPEVMSHFRDVDPEGIIFQDQFLESYIKNADLSSIYNLFYFSGQEINRIKISDAHFTDHSYAKDRFQQLDQEFSAEFQTWINKYQPQAFDSVPAAAVGLLTLLKTRKPIYVLGASGLTIVGVIFARAKLMELFDNSREILAQEVLAQYYISKHLEYHKCISDKMPNLPDVHPFSAENLAKEQTLVNAVVGSQIQSNANNVINDSANDCRFEFGNNTLNNLLCVMIKGFMEAMANFFVGSFGFLDKILSDSST